MKDIIYRHYGAEKLNIDFQYRKCLTNNAMKPRCGLWASRIDSPRSWKQWCEGESFRLSNFEKYFDFKLKPEARICYIHSSEDAENFLSRFPGEGYPTFMNGTYGLPKFPDYRSASKYFDGVEVFISDDPTLYHTLYGWDVDSIVIWNLDVVEPIE